MLIANFSGLEAVDSSYVQIRPLFRFIHKFKDVTGTTPGKYVTSIRMNEAKKLLSETSLHVKEVASIVGYENPLYFSRVFCSTVGMPPSRYKEQFL